MNKRILVIDDDLAIRKSFSLALEDSGFVVETADCGEQGLEKRRDTGFDLVFLDLKMPGLNGVQTLRELRKIDRSMPVYLVTAFHQEFLSQLDEAIADGIQFELLQKPLGNDQILLAATSAFEGPVVIQ